MVCFNIEYSVKMCERESLLFQNTQGIMLFMFRISLLLSKKRKFTRQFYLDSMFQELYLYDMRLFC